MKVYDLVYVKPPAGAYSNGITFEPTQLWVVTRLEFADGNGNWNATLQTHSLTATPRVPCSWLTPVAPRPFPRYMVRASQPWSGDPWLLRFNTETAFETTNPSGVFIPASQGVVNFTKAWQGAYGDWQECAAPAELLQPFNFQPGDKVQCTRPFGSSLVPGRVYTVADLGPQKIFTVCLLDNGHGMRESGGSVLRVPRIYLKAYVPETNVVVPDNRYAFEEC